MRPLLLALAILAVVLFFAKPASPWEFEDVRAEEAAMARVAETLARDAGDEVRVHALHRPVMGPVRVESAKARCGRCG